MEFTGAQLQYLDHLGIDVWVPREQLLQQAVAPSHVDQQQVVPPVNDGAFSEPVRHTSEAIAPQVSASMSAANPSPQASTQAPNHDAAVAPGANQVAPAVVQSAATAPANQSASPLNSAPAYPVSDLKAVQGNKQADQAEQPSIEKAPIFNIQFWCYSSGLWLVSGSVNLEPEHHKLVHNIAQFVQGKKRKPRHVGIFSWPMIDSPNIDQGPEVAAKHLKDHIHRLQEISAVTKVLAFSDCDEWFSHLNPVKADFTVDEILQSAENKKALWQQLLPHQITE